MLRHLSDTALSCDLPYVRQDTTFLVILVYIIYIMLLFYFGNPPSPLTDIGHMIDIHITAFSYQQLV